MFLTVAAESPATFPSIIEVPGLIQQVIATDYLWRTRGTWSNDRQCVIEHRRQKDKTSVPAIQCLTD